MITYQKPLPLTSGEKSCVAPAFARVKTMGSTWSEIAHHECVNRELDRDYHDYPRV